MIIRKLFV